MTTESGFVFVVTTADKKENVRVKDEQISVINKQVALHKHKQRREAKKEKGEKTGRVRPVLLRLKSDFDHPSTILPYRRQSEHSHPSSSESSGSPPESISYQSSEQDACSVTKNYTPKVEYTPANFEAAALEDACLFDCYAGLRTDPFLSMPIEDSSVVLSVADTYTKVIIPNFRPIAQVFNVQDQYLNLFWELVFDEDTIDAVMAMVFGNESNMRKSANVPPSKNLFVHLGKALTRLRQRMSNLNIARNSVTVAMLMYVAGVARHIGDVDAFEQYKLMIKSFVASFSDLSSLGYDGKLKCILLQWDFFWALNGGQSLLSKPRYQSTYPELPLRQDLRELVRQLPEGFIGLAESGRLSIEVLYVLQRVQRLLASSQSAAERQCFLDEPLTNAHMDFCSAVPCLGADDTNGPVLEKLLCFALVLFSTNTMNPIKPRKSTWGQVAVGSRAFLTEQLGRCQVTSILDEQCLIWIWLIAIDSWGIGIGVLLPEGVGLLHQFRKHFPFLMSWSCASKIAQRFFWTSDLEDFGQSVW